LPQAVKSLTTIKAIITGACGEGLTVFCRSGQAAKIVATMYKEMPSADLRTRMINYSASPLSRNALNKK
jgi:hypothetical protein